MDASTIILGFTGSIGSGASYIAKGLADECGYKYYKVSDAIKEYLKSIGHKGDTFSTKLMQDTGNELRRNNSNGYLVSALLEKIDREKHELPGGTVIFDGIKNIGEVQTLRQFPNFYLFSVNADYNVRMKRCTNEDSGSFENEEQFGDADKRDEFEQYSYGQQVKDCNYQSDIIIVNNKNILPVATHDKQNLIRNKIHRRYVERIKKSTEGAFSAEHSPHIDEMCMTLAYAMSKKSCCMKRKVGAVIVDIENTKVSDEDATSSLSSVPYIVSSGFNEVPIGLVKCAFHEIYKGCYRDHSQEQYAPKIKHCPNCGSTFTIDSTCSCGEVYPNFIKRCRKCGKEIETKAECPNCKMQIFKEFLPGAKHSVGKLLDICRAVHAEEMAILRLVKYGITGANLSLYTTTYPCNLCANKIVTSGIKRVIYAESYTMPEAESILKKGKVELVPFQGIKSSAYFKLYNT